MSSITFYWQVSLFQRDYIVIIVTIKGIQTLEQNMVCIFSPPLPPTGERARLLQGRAWGGSGGGHQARSHRCPGPPANSHQSHGSCCAQPQRHATGCVCGGRLHADGHHLRAHHGAGKASACNSTCPWHLSLSLVWQVRANTCCTVVPSVTSWMWMVHSEMTWELWVFFHPKWTWSFPEASLLFSFISR